jgi:hypothetical protein
LPVDRGLEKVNVVFSVNVCLKAALVFKFIVVALDVDVTVVTVSRAIAGRPAIVVALTVVIVAVVAANVVTVAAAGVVDPITIESIVPVPDDVLIACPDGSPAKAGIFTLQKYSYRLNP